EDRAVLGASSHELRTLRQEPISRMDRVRTDVPRGPQDRVDVQVTLGWKGASDPDALVHRLSMEGRAIRIREHADRTGPHVARGSRDPDRDLAPVRDEEPTEHAPPFTRGCSRASSEAGSRASSGGPRTRSRPAAA